MIIDEDALLRRCALARSGVPRYCFKPAVTPGGGHGPRRRPHPIVFLAGPLTSQSQSAADELFGRHLVSLMHLDKTTDEAELTEVVCVRLGDGCGVCVSGVCYIWFVCAASVCLCGRCVSWSVYLCMCAHFLCVCVQSGQSILKTLSGRIDFLSPDPVTQLTPRVALPCHFATRIKVKTSWK